MATKQAFVTLLTKDDYLPGALVVHASLKAVKSNYPLIILTTPSLPQQTLDVLRRRGIDTIPIKDLRPSNPFTLPEENKRFADTWTKLRAFELVQYDRVVMMDSDMLVLRNMDELFDLDLPEGWIAAAHVCACNPNRIKDYPEDWVPENCAYTGLKAVATGGLPEPTPITATSPRAHTLLNSGLVVLRPSMNDANALKAIVNDWDRVKNYKFPDQDALAAHFLGKWTPLPYAYNALKTLKLIHVPLWRDDEVRCLHYILSDKPWKARPGAEGTGGQYEVLNRLWWDQLDSLVKELRYGSEMVLGILGR
ncbi:glycosyltransferase family 8 protein [Auriscalpium vulgare]|uniref:Glycosyltransferase family 8 protein n=1 Tax=Auriscalpium vulgare TaxID=40419 RepID=A0ACB8S649_9AGAM|nr:glycosyltransferase family 8 protein [Auriscalpium vulgare]